MYMLYWIPDTVHVYCTTPRILYMYMLYCTPDTVHAKMLYRSLATFSHTQSDVLTSVISVTGYIGPQRYAALFITVYDMHITLC